MPSVPWRRLAAAGVAGSTTALLAFAGGASAAAPVDLRSAASFAVMGATTVTSAGVSTLTGDLGVAPGTAITGFPPGTVNGGLHPGDAAAVQAHADLAAAYQDAVGRGPEIPITGDLGGATLAPGVHAAGAALAITGDVTLDAGGDPDAVFVLKAGSTLGTSAGSHVLLAGKAQACNVVWQVGSSATLGASSALAGTILASTSISFGDGVRVRGRALARDGAVTLINDTIAVAPCTGVLSSTAPAITAFSGMLTGVTRTIRTAVGGWSVTDATGGNDGYAVTVSATAPTVDGSTARAGTGASLTLTPTTAQPHAGNPATVGPTSTSAQLLGPSAATIATAAPGAGRGTWDFPADTAAARSLAVLVPGNASTGSYASTLTFTAAPPAR